LPSLQLGSKITGDDWNTGRFFSSLNFLGNCDKNQCRFTTLLWSLRRMNSPWAFLHSLPDWDLFSKLYWQRFLIVPI